MDLDTLVCSLLSFEASFAYDIIYSLLSIARDTHKIPEHGVFSIKPNYKRSTRDLFVAFVKHSIEASGSLDIICRHWAPDVKDSLEKKVEMPSWISSLTKSPFGIHGRSQGRQNGENF